MIQKYLIIGLLLGFFPYVSTSYAQETNVLQQAQVAINNGDRSKALSLYQTLYSEGFDTAELHYNIGTLLAQEKKRGRAIFHLQRALRLAPFDENVKSNLLNVQSVLADNAFSKPLERALWERMIQALPQSSTTWAWFVFLTIGWIWFLWRNIRSQKTPLRKSAVGLALILGLAFTFLLTTKKNLSMRQYAVLTSNDVSGQSAPSDKAESAFIVQEGAYGEMIEAQNQYIRLRLQNGLEAWFHEKYLYFGQNNAP